jgi:ATP phosphoribosyltransferase regulatory subunit
MSLDQDMATQAAWAALKARGAHDLALPTLLPAALVLELAGEDLRPRLYFASGPQGDELCLRADLTIPAALHYCQIATHDHQEVAWACEGKVFRAPKPGEDRSPEFTQIGLERFGDVDTIEADVAVFLAAWEACQAAGLQKLHVRLCDGGLLPQIIAKAALQAPWGEALSEVANHASALRRVLDQASGNGPKREISALERTIGELDQERARSTVAEVLALAQFSLPGARQLSHVADRLSARARRALAPPLDASTAQTLARLVTMRSQDTLEASLDELVNLAHKLGVDLSVWRQAWAERLKRISQEAPLALAHAHFEALSPEAFDYYDGMAFDFSLDASFARPVATGGRYDTLVGVISGGRRQARAVGCVVRPARFRGQ